MKIWNFYYHFFSFCKFSESESSMHSRGGWFWYFKEQKFYRTRQNNSSLETSFFSSKLVLLISPTLKKLQNHIKNIKCVSGKSYQKQFLTQRRFSYDQPYVFAQICQPVGKSAEKFLYKIISKKSEVSLESCLYHINNMILC